MVAAPPHRHRPVVAICGGVGGAKLALGLARASPADALTVVVNTGDDFRHLGLHISPDLDTVLYTLAGIANPETGWGRAGETWHFMDTLAALGGETWFRLGDRDLAVHVERTRRLAAGERLSAIVDDFRHRFRIGARVLPMSDDPVRTVVTTEAGDLPFQHYFVREGCVPKVTGFRFEGASEAQALPTIRDALARSDLRVVVICPSNPFVSVDPILAVPGIRAALRASAAPVVAVSPIVAGKAIKGPAAKMMAELGVPPTAADVARHYGDLIDGFVRDARDADEPFDVPVPVLSVPTVMRTLADRRRLADVVLQFADRLHVAAQSS